MIIIMSVLVAFETYGYWRFLQRATQLEKLAEDLNGVFQAVIKDSVAINATIQTLGEDALAVWDTFGLVDKDMALVETLLNLYGKVLSIDPEKLKRIGEIQEIKRTT